MVEKTEILKGRQLPLFELDDGNIEKQKKHSGQNPIESEFGKYIVYVDESGDHSLQSIDQQYPVFVLAFCVFHKRHYSEAIVPAIEKFKFNHFGHDQVILHEHEIRKQKGVFRSLIGLEKQTAFMKELNAIVEFSNFILISTVIDKLALRKQGVEGNAYHMALAHYSGMEEGACLGMKDIGKPCTGKLYARFDEGGLVLTALYSTSIFVWVI